MPLREELVATRDRMRSRGPDGEGFWESPDKRCLLGHRRLSIIDLSERGAQPMARSDGDYVVTFNGEIYNYPELRSELETQGVSFRSDSDTEVLLHLYAREGRAMLTRLRGMFAFAIWDEARKGLFLARDPYGIKPLYTANDGWTFRFASQVKALLAGGKVSRDPEPAGVVGFHLFGSVPEPFTLYREIRALPAGHSQWIDAAGPREPQRYFNIAAILAAAPASRAGVAQTVREAVRESVQAHLLADVEVGLFLSAGIDSGALLGLMTDVGHRQVRAITLGFEEFAGTPEDEAPLAAQVARRYGAQHIIRTVGEAEFREDLPAILEAMDQPSIDGINSWFVAKAAREAGLKVALSGLGSDELLAGYPSFSDVPRWKKRFGPVAALPGSGVAVRKLLMTVRPQIAQRNPKALGMVDHAGSWGGAYLLRRGLFLPHELTSVMNPDTAREGLRRLRPTHMLEAALEPEPRSTTARVSVLESSFYMRNQLLRDADWAGMAHSIEIRVPLVDVRVLEALAPHVHGLRKGEGKSALAQAPSLPLPDEVAQRSKSGFGVPTHEWMRAAADARAGSGFVSKGLTSRRWSQVALECAQAA